MTSLGYFCSCMRYQYIYTRSLMRHFIFPFAYNNYFAVALFLGQDRLNDRITFNSQCELQLYFFCQLDDFGNGISGHQLKAHTTLSADRWMYYFKRQVFVCNTLRRYYGVNAVSCILIISIIRIPVCIIQDSSLVHCPIAIDVTTRVT